LIVRGYTKAGLSATKSSEIKDCKDLQQVRPSVVIDAVGEPLTTGDIINQFLMRILREILKHLQSIRNKCSIYTKLKQQETLL
jgi:hypothetical protein